eukprot:4179413-Pleurochrysis_carterae.AAC.1
MVEGGPEGTQIQRTDKNASCRIFRESKTGMRVTKRGQGCTAWEKDLLMYTERSSHDIRQRAPPAKCG